MERIVHTSITHPDAQSELPYFRGKAQLEAALAATGPETYTFLELWCMLARGMGLWRPVLARAGVPGETSLPGQISRRGWKGPG